MTAASARTIRVLIAKCGLDGHDVGAKVICRGLMDAGMEVIYTGLRQSPEAIAKVALEEDVDVVGVSILSGAHLPLAEKLATQFKEVGLRPDAIWLMGGNIPAKDHPALKEMGVSKVFQTGSDIDEVARFIEQQVKS